VRIDDVAADPRFYGGVDRATGVTTRNLLCVPLRSNQGIVGVVQVVNRRSAGGFSDTDLAFLEALAGSVAIAIENARIYAQLKDQVAALERAVQEHNELVAIRRELDIASGIQQSILPRTFPPFPQRKDFDIFADMLPAREVGGDFYDFFLVDDARLGLVIGDVSGKGVPAALFMAVSRTVLKAVAMTNAPPAECLQRVKRPAMSRQQRRAVRHDLLRRARYAQRQARVQHRRAQSSVRLARQSRSEARENGGDGARHHRRRVVRREDGGPRAR
jgi:serine phosphatase RsbU (regulator of sigma subunit)